MRIGKENVYRAPAPYVADLLLGPPGSELEVSKTRRSRHSLVPWSDTFAREGQRDDVEPSSTKRLWDVRWSLTLARHCNSHVYIDNPGGLVNMGEGRHPCWQCAVV